jgi:hypothetical protein
MPKIALCLFGQPRAYLRGYEVYKQLMDNNKDYEFDVFYHTWFDEDKQYYETSHWRDIPIEETIIDENIISKLNDVYKPKKYRFEKSIQFDSKKYQNTIIYANTNASLLNNFSNTISQHYTRNQVRNILNEYIEETNESYEFVILGRFDFKNLIHIKFNELNNDLIYVSGVHYPRNIIPDFLCISNVKHFLLFSNTYDNLDQLVDNYELKTAMVPLREEHTFNSENLLLMSIVYHNLFSKVAFTNKIPDFH